MRRAWRSRQLPATRVTSDTPEFCDHLARQVRREVRQRGGAPVPDEVSMLEQEGSRMCREGHVRPGILRIRQALMILKHQ